MTSSRQQHNESRTADTDLEVHIFSTDFDEAYETLDDFQYTPTYNSIVWKEKLYPDEGKIILVALNMKPNHQRTKILSPPRRPLMEQTPDLEVVFYSNIHREASKAAAEYLKASSFAATSWSRKSTASTDGVVASEVTLTAVVS
jgi:hypothetical protein